MGMVMTGFEWRSLEFGSNSSPGPAVRPIDLSGLKRLLAGKMQTPDVHTVHI